MRTITTTYQGKQYPKGGQKPLYGLDLYLCLS